MLVKSGNGEEQMRLNSTCRLLVCFVAALVTGCGPPGPFDYVPVSGKVVFEDGSPLTVGRVVFQPLAPPVGAAHPRAGTADLNSNGEFTSATSYKPNDGLVPGEHKVAIMYAVDDAGKPLVADEFTNIATTPLTVNTADVPFTITIKKP